MTTNRNKPRPATLRPCTAALVRANDLVLTEGPYVVLYEPRHIIDREGRDYVVLIDLAGHGHIVRGGDRLTIIEGR